MTYVHINHSVKDYDAWKPYFDEHDATRTEMGQQGYQLYQAADDPNHVVALIEFDTEANAKAFTESKELRKKMKEAGVKGKPTISFLTEAESKDVAQPSA